MIAVLSANGTNTVVVRIIVEALVFLGNYVTAGKLFPVIKGVAIVCTFYSGMVTVCITAIVTNTVAVGITICMSYLSGFRNDVSTCELKPVISAVALIDVFTYVRMLAGVISANGTYTVVSV